MKKQTKTPELPHETKLRKANELLAKANLEGLFTTPKQPKAAQPAS